MLTFVGRLGRKRPSHSQQPADLSSPGQNLTPVSAERRSSTWRHGLAKRCTVAGVLLACRSGRLTFGRRGRVRPGRCAPTGERGKHMDRPPKEQALRLVLFPFATIQNHDLCRRAAQTSAIRGAAAMYPVEPQLLTAIGTLATGLAALIRAIAALWRSGAHRTGRARRAGGELRR